MQQPSILIIGSSNTDMVVKCQHLPAPGETIIGGTFFMNAGGKGANQAVAAARLGGKITLITKTGNDIFGRQAIQSFKDEQIDTTAVLIDEDLPSGVALITVDDAAENCIVVAPGANAALTPALIEPFSDMIASAAILLMQLEIPLETVGYAAEKAFHRNLPVILNPALACSLADPLLKHISIITPNEKEASMLTGIEVNDETSAKDAALFLHKKGIPTVIITMGAKGALVYDGSEFFLVESPVVKAIDTTAAGDVFNGALAVALSEGKEIKEAVTFACRAASIAVTRLGAQASAPYRYELD